LYSIQQLVGGSYHEKQSKNRAGQIVCTNYNVGFFFMFLGGKTKPVKGNGEKYNLDLH
jgi:hypothetical protein